MDYGIACIKLCFFIFCVIFGLAGFGIMMVGIAIKTVEKEILDVVGDDFPVNLSVPSSIFIAVGTIIFIAAYFGCCAAAIGNFFMVLSFAMLLLTLFVFQLGIAIYIYGLKKDINASFNAKLEKIYDKYFDYSSPDQRTAIAAVNAVQSLIKCCGYKSYRDFPSGQIPYSCCEKKMGEFCKPNEAHADGCETKAFSQIQDGLNSIGNLALGIAVIELFGVIVSFVLVYHLNPNVQRYRGGAQAHSSARANSETAT